MFCFCLPFFLGVPVSVTGSPKLSLVWLLFCGFPPCHLVSPQPARHQGSDSDDLNRPRLGAQDLINNECANALADTVKVRVVSEAPTAPRTRHEGGLVSGCGALSPGSKSPPCGVGHVLSQGFQRVHLVILGPLVSLDSPESKRLINLLVR